AVRPCLADRRRVPLLGHLGLDPPVEVLVLEVEHRVRILDRAREQPLRVLGRRRADAFQAGDVRERALRVLRMERAAGEAAAGREPHDDRHRRPCPVELLRRDRDQLVPGARDEVRELHLGDGAHPHQRGAGARADDRRLRERRVDHAPGTELLLEPERDLERAPVDADVLADHVHALVAAHLEPQAVGDRLKVRQLRHYLWCGVSRSSGEAKTPSVTVEGSGSGDSSARLIASLRSFLISEESSSSSSSERSACSRSQVRKRSIGSLFAHSSNMSFGTLKASSWTAWPSIRRVRHSISVGPPPSRAFSTARFASRYTASTSVPSTTTPSKPYPWARSARCSTAYSRCVGVEYAHWLLSQTKTTGSARTAAKFIPSCVSPRAEAPSPNHATATRFSSRMRKASAQPTATGSIAGRCETIAIRPRRASAMWTLPSRPLAGPSTRPM